MYWLHHPCMDTWMVWLVMHGWHLNPVIHVQEDHRIETLRVAAILASQVIPSMCHDHNLCIADHAVNYDRAIYMFTIIIHILWILAITCDARIILLCYKCDHSIAISGSMMIVHYVRSWMVVAMWIARYWMCTIRIDYGLYDHIVQFTVSCGYTCVTLHDADWIDHDDIDHHHGSWWYRLDQSWRLVDWSCWDGLDHDSEITNGADWDQSGSHWLWIRMVQGGSIMMVKLDMIVSTVDHEGAEEDHNNTDWDRSW